MGFAEFIGYVKKAGEKVLTYFPSKTDLISVVDSNGNVTDELLSERLAYIEEMDQYTKKGLVELKDADDDVKASNHFVGEDGALSASPGVILKTIIPSRITLNIGDIVYITTSFQIYTGGKIVTYPVGYYKIETVTKAGSDYYYLIATHDGTMYVTYLGESYTVDDVAECNLKEKITSIDCSTEELANTDKLLLEEMETLKKSVGNGKTAVADAITQMGVTTAADADFATMAANVLNIVGKGDVTVEQVSSYINFTVGQENETAPNGAEGVVAVGTFHLTEKMVSNGYLYLILKSIYSDYIEYDKYGLPGGEILWIVVCKMDGGCTIYDAETYDYDWIEQNETSGDSENDYYVAYSYVPVVIKIPLQSVEAGEYGVYIAYSGYNETAYFPTSHSDGPNSIHIDGCYVSTNEFKF